MATKTAKMPSPDAIKTAMEAALEAIAAIGDTEDRELLLDTIEGESDIFEQLDKLVEQSLADGKLVEAARERAARLEARAKRARTVALQIVERLGVSPLERPLFTASVSYHREIGSLDETVLPEQWWRHAPDKIAIAKALRGGEKIAGASLGNDQPRLMIKTQ